MQHNFRLSWTQRLSLLGMLLLALLMTAFIFKPVRATSATIVPTVIATDTTWTKSGSPYRIQAELTVEKGATLTIEPGVTVESDNVPVAHYNFQVLGTLIARGTAAEPITFQPSVDGWSGILIDGEPGSLNRGSVLEYVILNGGGNGGSGSGANLVLRYAEATVRHCQFNDSPGDGILGDNGGTQGVAHVYDSTFTHNAGYAIDFEDGSVNPVLANLIATGNGWDNGYGSPLLYGGNLVYIDNDTLHGAHTWENMGLPYLIVGTIVGEDSVLTIEPGVQVLAMPGNDSFNVAGRLVANATAAQSIHLDPADPATGWAGLHIIGSNTQLSTGNVLNHVIIDKGGVGGWCGLSIEYGAATVTNSVIKNSLADSGVCLDHEATLNMTDTQLTGNEGYAMDITDPDAQFTLARLTATSNLTNSIGMGDRGYIHRPQAWTRSGINTIDLHNAVTVAPDGSLSIDPGLTVRAQYGRALTVQGVLTATGTSADPILFTGVEHTPGYWGGIAFTGSATQRARGTFKYTTIEDGGYGGYAMVEAQNADVTLDYCTLRNSSADAIRILPDLEFAARLRRMTSTPPVQISWSKFVNIGGDAIYNGSSQAMLAAYNWWSSATGPTADDNPTGVGEPIEGPVIYRPFLSSPNISFVFLPLVKR